MKTIVQFGFVPHKTPENIPVIDCRRLPNPYREPDAVKRRLIVHSSPIFECLVIQALTLLKTNEKIGIGCSYGIHRSALVAEEVECRFDGNVKILKLS